jgi:hypothetical protein
VDGDTTQAGQTYTEDLKVLKLASMINVPNSNALTLYVEVMKNNYRRDFNGALTYITTRINELNASKPSAGTRHISAIVFMCASLPDATLSSVPIYDFAIANEGLRDEDMEQYYLCGGKTIMCKGCIYSTHI